MIWLFCDGFSCRSGAYSYRFWPWRVWEGMVLIRLASVRRRWGGGSIRLYSVAISSGSASSHDIKHHFAHNKTDHFSYESILCESTILAWSDIYIRQIDATYELIMIQVTFDSLCRWAPVLIAVVIIAILIGCGICCCCIPGFCFCCWQTKMDQL